MSAALLPAAAPWAAVVGATPVAPGTPPKDYSGVWLPIVLGTVLAIALVLGLLALGWRSRRRAQTGLPAPAAVPPAVLEQEPTLAAEGMYVGTVRGAGRLDRVVAHGLGLRSDALLEVHAAGAHPGVLVLRPGMDPLFVPGADLVDAGLSAGIAGKFTEPNGLVAWGWRLGGEDLTTAFRPRRAEDRARVLAALQTVIDPDRTAPADRAAQEETR